MVLRLETAAYTDSMTGLLNRGRFMELGEQMIETRSHCRLYLIDVDHFKAINDEFGHTTGDMVIREAARRIRLAIGDRGLIARLGGDEFVVLHSDGSTSEAGRLTGETLVQAFADPFVFNGGRLQLSSSVGVADNTVSAANLDQLIIDADLALYRAKESGRNRVVVFDRSMHNQRIRRRQIEKLLTRALLEDGFEFRYQPMYHAVSGELVAFETLLRLKTAGGEYVAPADFIPIAEEMRLMVEIGERVFRAAVAFSRLVPEPVRVGVNLSPRQFCVANARGLAIEDAFGKILDEAGVDGSRFALEVTQGCFDSETDGVIGQLDRLQAMGFRIALDDFGDGPTNLSCLWKFAFNTIKISQTFARSLGDNAVTLSEIVRSIVNMSHTLGIRVIAEGVETEAEATFFTETGCDILQGFLLARPMREEDAAAMIASGTLFRQVAASQALATRSEKSPLWMTGSYG